MPRLSKPKKPATSKKNVTPSPGAGSRHPEYDPEFQRGYDDAVADILEAMEFGYMDDHLRDLVRAAYSRREVLTGKVLVVRTEDAARLTEALSAPKAPAPQTEQITRKEPEPAQLVTPANHSLNQRYPDTSYRVLDGVPVNINFATMSEKEERGRTDFSYKGRWYNLHDYEGEVVQYANQHTKGGRMDTMWRSLFEVVKVGSVTTVVRPIRLPSTLRSNSVAVKAQRNGSTIRIANTLLFHRYLN